MSEETFESTIDGIPNISREQSDLVKSKFKLRKYDKNVFVGRAGDITKFTAYVRSGCVSNFRILKNGKKAINHFAFEDWWVGDLDSFLKQKPAETFWLTLEPTELLAISKTDFDELMTAVPPFEVFFLKKTQSAFLKEMENADKDKTETALERYIRMMKDYPKILQRVPNYEIAAYLGIAPELLSRIRKEAMKKNS